ncbi:MAG: hypothetical protein Q8Q88_20230 [Phenylobacterium sp.]|uniref:hypothetical protein n=1 Tax=Phenylobacterium sp. TaxID=1871053 RepID=UPI00273424C8|nr:hypothetical protein [Phenylobacterium sp.]MDP3749371.1 hypothetical protein [Phenylobacterium sp.]
MSDVVARLRRALEAADGEDSLPADTTDHIEVAARAFLAALPPELGAILERRLAAFARAVDESPAHTPVEVLAQRAREIVKRLH